MENPFYHTKPDSLQFGPVWREHFKGTVHFPVRGPGRADALGIVLEYLADE